MNALRRVELRTASMVRQCQHCRRPIGTGTSVAVFGLHYHVTCTSEARKEGTLYPGRRHKQLPLFEVTR